MATDPWAAFNPQPANTSAQPASAPQFPGVIQGRPKQPDARGVFEDERDFETSRRDKLFEQTSKLRDEFNAFDFVKEYPTVARQYSFALQTAPNPSGDQALITAYAKMLDPTSVVREAEFDTTAAADSALARTIARVKREFGMEGGGRLSPEGRTKVREAMRTLVQQYDTQYQQARSRYGQLAEEYGFDPNLIVGDDYSKTYADTINAFWDDQQRTANAGGDPDSYSGFRDDGLYVRISDDSPTAREQEVQSRADALDEATGRYGGLDIARSGVSFGLADEAAGIGTAIGAALTGDLNFASNYRMGRDVEEERLNRARTATGPVGSTALEMLGGGGAIRNVAGLTGNIVRQGVGLGALGGFGYGRDLEGSTANALIGAAAGGTLGYAGQRIGNALANRQARNFDPARAQQVAQAGEAEGVTVNRAMIDPRQENVFSGVEATRFGGPRVNQQMDAIEGQIEGRIQQLGGNRQPLDRVAVGDRVQRAGERFIADSRNVTNRKYQVAEKLAGDAKVQPVQSRAAADAMIRELSETGNLNSAEIKFLEGIRDDLGKPLSISALRSMRTKLRKKISKGELVFGEDEARVIGIMDEAANDIRAGLSQQGKAQAADAFAAADTAYAARMDYINSTVQKLIGRRGANMSAEQVASKFESMARNDAEGLRKFWSALGPEERADMQATFAGALGRNNKGEFSPAIFLNNVGGSNRKMSERAIRTVFGKDGAQSVANLKTLATEVNRLNAMRNSSNTARGNNYNSWLLETLGFLGGGGAGIASGSGGIGTAATAAAGAATMGGLKAGRDILNARMLMSPKIQKWIAQAPKTANPKAIDAHFGRLEAIARAEPALAGDIEALRQGIMRAANDNPATTLAAEDHDLRE